MEALLYRTPGITRELLEGYRKTSRETIKEIGRIQGGSLEGMRVQLFIYDRDTERLMRDFDGRRCSTYL